jgi:hypothetical protein
MARSALSLLLAGLLAVAIGVLGVAAVANSAVASSEKAADTANSTDLGKPAGYGNR